MNCHVTRDALDLAVEARFNIIRAAHEFHPRDEHDPRAHYGYCYDGNRTLGSELGWRLRQMFGSFDPAEIEAGARDTEIAIIFHDAADTEYYYRFEKNWG
jgi:hypothetical protein